MKRNKKYSPRHVNRNPFSAFGGLSGDHAAHLQRLLLRNHGAMARMVQGQGSRPDWDLLVGFINMAIVMCEQGIGREYRLDILNARTALLEQGKRAMRINKFGFTGDEIKAMNLALEIHDAQLTNIRAIDAERACDEVLRRFNGKTKNINVVAEFMAEERAA